MICRIEYSKLIIVYKYFKIFELLCNNCIRYDTNGDNMSNKMYIKEHEYSKSIYEIRIENIRKNSKCFLIVEKILNKLLNKKEIYFGFYRTDGINIPNGHFKHYKRSINNFFDEYGEFKEINEYLSVAKIESNSALCEILPIVLDYYLDIIIFDPKIEWSKYVIYHSKYMEHNNIDYILNGYADILFSYSDSSDFSIIFSTEKIMPENIKNAINKLLQEQ